MNQSLTQQFYHLCYLTVYIARHSLGQHLSQQLVCLLSLHLQLLGPLSNQILQVGWVLLQHAQHRVDDVGLLSLGDVLELSHTEAQNRDVISPYCISMIGIKVCFQCFYLFENLLKGRPLLRLFAPALFHDLDHVYRGLVHWHNRPTQWRTIFDLADDLCQHTQTIRTIQTGTHRCFCHLE